MDTTTLAHIGIALLNLVNSIGVVVVRPARGTCALAGAGPAGLAAPLTVATSTTSTSTGGPHGDQAGSPDH